MAHAPHDSPPWKAVPYYFHTRRGRGVWEEVRHAPRAGARTPAGRGPAPSAGVIDGRPVKTTGAGGPGGYDAGGGNRRPEAASAG